MGAGTEKPAGLPAFGIGGAGSGGGSGIALNNPNAMGRGVGASEPPGLRPSAFVTAWLARSILLRLPSHSSQVLVPLSLGKSTRTACVDPSVAARAPRVSGGPAITVTPVLWAPRPPG